MKKIIIAKKSIYSFLISFALFIPLLEVSWVREVFSFSISGRYISPVLTIMMILIPIFIFKLCTFKIRRNNEYFKYVKIFIYCNLIFNTIAILRGIILGDVTRAIIALLWTSVPVIYAMLLISLILCMNISSRRILKELVMIFTIYSFINIIMNVLKYGFSFKGGSRLVSIGGGPVIYGYTICIIISLLFYMKEEFNRIVFCVSLIILIVASFMTGSRGSMWPIVLILIISVTLKKMKLKDILFIIGIIILIIIINPFNIINQYVPRFFEFESSARKDTFVNAIEIFKDYSISEKLFGGGLGNVFPYTSWLNQKQFGYVFSHFDLSGYSLLVQPHNIYIYILLETGLSGLTLFFLPMVKTIKLVKEQYVDEYKKYAMVVLFLIIILNSLDSVLWVVPSVASIWYFIIFELGIIAIKNKKRGDLK